MRSCYSSCLFLHLYPAAEACPLARTAGRAFLSAALPRHSKPAFVYAHRILRHVDFFQFTTFRPTRKAP
eukprot:1545809-Prymnesium_polylepis.1